MIIVNRMFGAGRTHKAPHQSAIHKLGDPAQRPEAAAHRKSSSSPATSEPIEIRTPSQQNTLSEF